MKRAAYVIRVSIQFIIHVKEISRIELDWIFKRQKDSLFSLMLSSSEIVENLMACVS
jgi:hypothetical protein